MNNDYLNDSDSEKENSLTQDYSNRTIKRLPLYLRMLRQMQSNGETYASSAYVAETLMIDPVMVRKDLSCTGVHGKPRIGFLIADLIPAIERLLGWDGNVQAILLGVGRLGSALLGYPGFLKYGFRIAAAFDINPAVKGVISDIPVYPPEKMKEVVEKESVTIGILALPAAFAQEGADKLVAAGVRGIWNFTPIRIVVPKNVVVRHEDLASGLALLSHKVFCEK